jgi:hypothetical protein
MGRWESAGKNRHGVGDESENSENRGRILHFNLTGNCACNNGTVCRENQE